VNSKGRQHAKLYILSLMVLMSIFSTCVIQSVDAFSIGLPDIPFLNFNFDNNSPKGDISSIIDFGAITNAIPNSNPDEDDKKDSSDSDHESSDNRNSNVQSSQEATQPSSASLPFPANMMTSVFSNENENTNEINKNPLNLQDTLPLVGDYSDAPSTFLSDTPTSDEEDDVIPGQYIVVFKDDDTTVSDFFSMISSKIDTQDIEVLQVYENVINGLTIKVSNDRVIEIIEQLPIVEYVEKDMMAQAFAQTLPSAVLGVLTPETEKRTT
jgi:subtilisin